VSLNMSTAMTDSKTALKPLEPKVGGLAQTKTDKWIAWTGGKPKVDWSGFEDAKRVDHETPNQMRPIYDPIYDVKGYNHRKTGLSIKFNKSDLLIPFKKRVWTHLKDNGLDSIACLPDMRNKMSCVIYDHLRYTLDSARTASKTQANLYDKHNVTNNTAAVAFLLDSLAPALSETTLEKLEDTDSFHVVWLQLMNEIQMSRQLSALRPSRRRSRIVVPSSTQDRTWKNLPFTFAPQPWNLRMPVSVIIA
jgi:hypothetical protein